MYIFKVVQVEILKLMIVGETDMPDFTFWQAGQMYNVYYRPKTEIKNLRYTKDKKQFYKDCGFLVVGN